MGSSFLYWRRESFVRRVKPSTSQESPSIGFGIRRSCGEESFLEESLSSSCCPGPPIFLWRSFQFRGQKIKESVKMFEEKRGQEEIGGGCFLTEGEEFFAFLWRRERWKFSRTAQESPGYPFERKRFSWEVPTRKDSHGCIEL